MGGGGWGSRPKKRKKAQTTGRNGLKTARNGYQRLHFSAVRVRCLRFKKVVRVRCLARGMLSSGALLYTLADGRGQRNG